MSRCPRGDRCRSAVQPCARESDSSKLRSPKPIVNVFTASGVCLDHQRDDRARVDASTKKRAKRHVAHQASTDGRPKMFAGTRGVTRSSV